MFLVQIHRLDLMVGEGQLVKLTKMDWVGLKVTEIFVVGKTKYTDHILTCYIMLYLKLSFSGSFLFFLIHNLVKKYILA